MARTKEQYAALIANRANRFNIEVKCINNRYEASINGKQFAMDLSAKEMYQALDMMWLFHTFAGNLCGHCGRFNTDLKMAAMSLSTGVKYYCPSCRGEK